MPFKALIFDFFGVICSEVTPFWLAKYLPESQANAVKFKIVSDADRGKISQGELFLTLSKLTHIPTERIEKEWLEYANIDNRMVDLVKYLRSRYKLGLLTNSPAPFFRRIISQNDLCDLFEAVVVSSENGYAKPDREIYQIILAKLAVEPADTLLIDDNPVNIEGATSVGMNAWLFVSYEQFSSALRQFT